jgi:hypothetical protein
MRSWKSFLLRQRLSDAGFLMLAAGYRFNDSTFLAVHAFGSGKPRTLTHFASGCRATELHFDGTLTK